MSSVLYPDAVTVVIAMVVLKSPLCLRVGFFFPVLLSCSSKSIRSSVVREGACARRGRRELLGVAPELEDRDLDFRRGGEGLST